MTNTKALMSSRRLLLAGVVVMLGMLDWPGVVAADPPCTIPSTAVFLEPQLPDPTATIGRAVAIDGDWIAVGVPGDEPTVAGRVELFHRVDGTWTNAGVLLPADGSRDDRFGFGLAMRGDTLLVGAFRAAGAAPNSGAAYVFRLTDGSWQEEAKLLVDDGQPFDSFGADVSLCGDHALVGVSGRDDFGSSAGAAYLFVHTATGWALEATLHAPDAAAGDLFGYSVEMDDGLIAIGANADDDDESAIAGSVRIFEHRPAGWTQTANLNAAESLYPTASGLLGTVVTLRGGTLLVNASFGGESTFGTLLEYRRSDGDWLHPRLVVAPGGQTTHRRSLMLGPTGDVAVWGGSFPYFGTELAIVRRDAAGWHAKQNVKPPAMVPAGGSIAAAFDGESLVAGRSHIYGGIPVAVAFVADMPPRDVDLDGLDDACEIASGLAEDCDDDGIIDDAQSPYRYVTDNIEDAWFLPCLLTVATGGDVLILNHFAVAGSDSGVVRSIGFVPPDFGDEPIDAAIASSGPCRSASTSPTATEALDWIHARSPAASWRTWMVT